MFEINSISMTVLLGSIQILKLLYPKGNVDRFENCLKSYLELMNQTVSDSSRKANDFLYPGLTHTPWCDRDNDVLKFVSDTLEKGFNDIETEWLAYRSSGYNIVPRYKHKLSDIFGESFKNKDEGWQYYLIWRQGKFTEAALLLFPKTVKILSSLKSFLYPFGEAVLIVMKPDVFLPPHTDDINTSISCHLGIKTPEGCEIKVGGKTRSWSRGKTLFFNHSFEHSAWNKSNEERVVLVMDLYHPELTKVEKILLKFVLKNFNLTGEEGGYNRILDLQYQKTVLANLETSKI
jgi:Aspartyl/Asparaginyl beta-hydroxylase